MIDLESPLDLPGLDVRAWADTDDPGQVWACADGPRWAVGADGAPETSLLIYRRGVGGPVEGGMVTVTVDLALTAEEREAVVTAAAERRDAESVGGGTPGSGKAGSGNDGSAAPERDSSTQGSAPWEDAPPDTGAGYDADRTDADHPERTPAPPPTCSPPQWSGGSIQIELVEGVASSTDASAMGDNRATFVLTLDASTGPQVAAAWADGLPDARATAELHVSTSVRGEAGSTASTTVPGLRSRMAVSVAMSRAVDAPVQLTSSLRIPSGVRTTSTTEITL